MRAIASSWKPAPSPDVRGLRRPLPKGEVGILLAGALPERAGRGVIGVEKDPGFLGFARNDTKTVEAITSSWKPAPSPDVRGLRRPLPKGEVGILLAGALPERAGRGVIGVEKDPGFLGFARNDTKTVEAIASSWKPAPSPDVRGLRRPLPKGEMGILLAVALPERAGRGVIGVEKDPGFLGFARNDTKTVEAQKRKSIASPEAPFDFSSFRSGRQKGDDGKGERERRLSELSFGGAWHPSRAYARDDLFRREEAPGI